MKIYFASTHFHRAAQTFFPLICVPRAKKTLRPRLTLELVLSSSRLVSWVDSLRGRAAPKVASDEEPSMDD